MPLISVVIPLYNKEPHIKRAIDSILTQKIQDFEIIIVDDGSTDKSAEVVKGFTDPRIRLIQQENMGVSAARNRGIKEAKADLIAFLDADDNWTPIFLETVLRLTEKLPEAGIYATAYDFLKNGRLKAAKYCAVPPVPWEGFLPSYFLSDATGDHPVCSSAVCIPKKIFFEIGMFKVGVRYGEDVDLWGRIALKHPIAFSREIGAIYHNDTVNRACKLESKIEEHPFVKSARDAIDKGDVQKEIYDDLMECIAKYQLHSAKRNIISGNRELAKCNLKNCKTKLFRWNKIFWYFFAYMPHTVSYNMLIFLIKIKNSVHQS
ncbi:glycosyltransferase family 2 protein [Methanosarcina sp. DH1]|uniref:glycosyltransferase family 2 protein n=1 Tax=Methanosarcina sp. DH1 TaxID=2605695 RepID=UPI001E34C2A8|nr:glycosyltransferase family 2 protein [Methanosarcina sp. DH1]